MENTQNIRIDISGTQPSPFEIVTQQYNTGEKIVFSIYKNGEPLDIGNYVVSMWMKKPDDTTIIDTYVVSDNTITVILSYQMTVLSGRIPYNIRLSRFVDSEGASDSSGTVENGTLDLGFFDDTPELEIVATVLGTLVVMPSAVTEEDITSQSSWGVIEKILAATTEATTFVRGVKGDAEEDYRTGNVNITKANIGLDNGRNLIFSTNEPVDASEGDIWIKYTLADDGSYTDVKKYIYETLEFREIIDDITLPASDVVLENNTTAETAITELQSRVTTTEGEIDTIQTVVPNSLPLPQAEEDEENPTYQGYALSSDENGQIRAMDGSDNNFPKITNVELGYLNGVRDNIQEQLDATAPTTFTKDRVIISGTSVEGSDEGTFSASDVTVDELNTLKNITTAVGENTIGDVLDSKQNTITGAASSVTDSNLTATRLLVSNSSGKIGTNNALTSGRAVYTNSAGSLGSSTTTTTELGYVHGVTSNIQTQLNSKQSALSTITKSVAVECASANTVYSLTITLTSSDGYSRSNDLGVFSVCSDTANIRIESVVETDNSLGVSITYTILYYSINANESGVINFYKLMKS